MDDGTRPHANEWPCTAFSNTNLVLADITTSNSLNIRPVYRPGLAKPVRRNNKSPNHSRVTSSFFFFSVGGTLAQMRTSYVPDHFNSPSSVLNVIHRTQQNMSA